MDRDRARTNAINRMERPPGDVVVNLPNWDFLPSRTKDHIFTKALSGLTLLAIPIPELGVLVNVNVSADASFGLHAGYSGQMQNVQVGLTAFQARALRMLGTDRDTLVRFAGMAGSVRGIADVVITGSVGLTATAGGRLDAVARALGVDIAGVAAGLNASGSASGALRLTGRVGWGLHDGRTQMRFSKSAAVDLALQFGLNAFVEAHLLGHSWRKNWQLANIDLGRTWRVGADLTAGLDGPAAAAGTSDLLFGEGNLNFETLARQLFSMATSPSTVTPLSPPASGGAGGSAPGGRSQSDPIPMIWHKHPGLYPTRIQLGGRSYFLTEPDWVVVPRGPDFADLRRHAATDADGQNAIRIGVPVASRSFPSVGRIWARVNVGGMRGGTAQDQFRRLLAHHGYTWNTHEADHVRDLQWGGRDEYDNLWPLERSHNLAGNNILNQPVTYRNSAGATVTVPLHQTPPGLYFRITGYA
ncbi:HNH endonuclease signature motif containing protein [Lentzea atacamensis]|nr:HNH endonuclease signature motif containing protein [Lentzea atacamensis]